MSLLIARVRGIPIRLHVTLLVVLALLVAQLGPFGLPAGAILFGSVLLHELGHALVAQRYGIPIARIDLHLLGGTAVMTGTPRSPREEVVIAAAGPAVSMALAVGFGVWAQLLGAVPTLELSRPSDLLAYATVINLGIGIFNLVPALPMDGGRIFRAALATKLGDLRATQIAASVSRVFGGVFVAVALYTGSFSLGLIGLLLFVLVGHEEAMAKARAVGPRPYATGPSLYVPFGPWAHRYPAREARPSEVVVDVGASGPAVEPETFVDPWGRRWVRVVRRPGPFA